MTKLVDEPLRAFRLAHDALFVVLSQAPGQFVVVHGGTVLAAAPETGHGLAVFDLEHAQLPVQPPDHLLRRLLRLVRTDGGGGGVRERRGRRRRGRWRRAVNRVAVHRGRLQLRGRRRRGQQFFEELPQVDVLRRRRGGPGRRADGRRGIVFRLHHGFRLKVHYRVGHVRLVVVVDVVFVAGRRGGRVAAALIVVRFDLEAHGVATVTAAVHVTAGHAVERSATSATVAADAAAAAAADVAAADVISRTGAVAIAVRRWDRGRSGRRLHHDRHQQPVVIVVGCRCFSRFPGRQLLDHIITVVTLKGYEK
uniref:Uncharacterized protein n=1 Tax=Schizaphis graminum TaxID=13262 RepID=A0A2S2P9C6_SCHGA